MKSGVIRSKLDGRLFVFVYKIRRLFIVYSLLTFRFAHLEAGSRQDPLGLEQVVHIDICEELMFCNGVLLPQNTISNISVSSVL